MTCPFLMRKEGNLYTHVFGVGRPKLGVPSHISPEIKGQWLFLHIFDFRGGEISILCLTCHMRKEGNLYTHVYAPSVLVLSKTRHAALHAAYGNYRVVVLKVQMGPYPQVIQTSLMSYSWNIPRLDHAEDLNCAENLLREIYVLYMDDIEH